MVGVIGALKEDTVQPTYTVEKRNGSEPEGTSS
jgi:hypothetical protein